MKPLVFHESPELSLGIELELQLIDPKSSDLLVSGAKSVLRSIRRLIKTGNCHWKIKPEVTQSMIEVNSAVHATANDLLEELEGLASFLDRLCKKLHILMSGGGTHPFQRWPERQIFPSPRYKRLAKQYGYLMKRYTVFGQHIHVGCANGDDAIYLTHALSRYVPQFIALSASSPFYLGIDTGFDCSRINIVNAFPFSGVIPWVDNWENFSVYYQQMVNLKIVESIRDFYWDIRPKPDLGSVEVRVCDSPLTIYKAVKLAAYVQAIAAFILKERPKILPTDFYMFYTYNRFQASRYGLQADFFNPYTKKRTKIVDDILKTVKAVMPYAVKLNSEKFILQLATDAKQKKNDARWLRKIYHRVPLLQRLVVWQSGLLFKDYGEGGFQ